MKYLNKETNGITLSRIGLGAMRMADIQQGVDIHIIATWHCKYQLLLFVQFFYHPCSYVYILYFIYPTF